MPKHVIYADYGAPVSEEEWQSLTCQQPASTFARGDSTRLRFLRHWVGSCDPEGLVARAAQLDSLRASTDLVLLEGLVRSAYEWVDGAIFQVAEAVAGDSVASTEARGSALRVLHWALFPGSYISHDQITQESPSSIHCIGGNRSLHMRLHLGTPLPEDFVERVDTVASQLRSDPETAGPLRNAAHCLRMGLYFVQRIDRRAAN